MHLRALSRPFRTSLPFLALPLAILLSACEAEDPAARASAASTGISAHTAPAQQSRPGSADAPLPPKPAPGPDGKVRLTEEEWRARLTPEQFKILRGAATERAFSCPLWKISDKPGVYHCAGCGLALFDSSDKFDSGTGWPSFTHPVAPGRIVEKEDRSHGMIRVETLCARCDGHLGHVFRDGPPPAGLRYCINGTVLRFEPAAEPQTPSSASAPASPDTTALAPSVPKAQP